MSSTSQKFVVIGPKAGQTQTINGHEFVDGEFTYHGSTGQVATLTRLFSFYAALPEQEAELLALRADKAPSDKAPSGDAPPSGSTEVDPKRDGVGADLEKPDLATAIGELDPEADADWTSNNLPSLERLGELTGKKVARGDVDAVADGYTRAKARATKQS